MENNLTYALCNIATDLQNIDFSQVGESSTSTVRRSVNDTLFVIKYNAEPTFINNGTVTPSQVLNHSECLQLMATEDWSNLNPEENINTEKTK